MKGGIWNATYYSLHANPLARSPGQVKLDWPLGQVKIMKEFVGINRKFFYIWFSGK